jgi:serine/threonine-protein kinase
VFLTHDPRFERDGLLTLARQAELRAVPALFGYPAAEVAAISTQRVTFATRTGAAGQEFLVTWKTGRRHMEVPYAIGGGAALGTTGFAHSIAGGVAAVLAGGAIGLATAIIWRRDRQRRTEGSAQNFRIRALERSMMLKDEQIRASAGMSEGTVIAGMYRLGTRLGVGASGVIHRAVRLSDNTPVAIKLLRAAVAHDALASDRLRREAEAMGLAWHPNVVELYDQGVLPDGTTYLVMELLEGESLSARLKRGGAMSADEFVPIATELCDALGAVHAAGVIHRDVKPGNIYLARVPVGAPPAEQRTRVKILDFGIARVEWAETRLTNFDSVVGTPGYMSPEQEQGGEIDARSDLYALGAVFFECLTGTPLPPTRGGENAPPSGIHKSAAALSPAWRVVLERAMAPAPRDRFVDAKAMRDGVVAAARASADEVAG